MAIGHAENGRAARSWAAGACEHAKYRVLLLKPRVMSLVVFTGGVGMAVAPGALDGSRMLITLVCMAAGAGACGALNMWYDADIDALMQRTLSRPIPRGKVAPSEALIEGTLLAILSVLCFGLYVNWTAAALLALTIGFYVFIYTMGLKRRTPQNIVIGGASGALPPLIGWAAQTNSIEWGGIVLFLIIFFWTPPHFWALALGRSQDYERAGVPMLPVVAGADATCRRITTYCAVLVPITYLPAAFMSAPLLYAAAATSLNALLAWRVYKLSQATDPQQQTSASFRLFGTSILYLFALFVALLLGAS